MSKIQKLSFKNFQWINITKPDNDAVGFLQEKYNFHPLDLNDCVSRSHRTKIDIYPDYAFLIILFPVYVRSTREIKEAELDFFISKKYIISVNHGNLPAFNDFFKLFELSTDFRKKYSDGSPERLLYEILNKLFNYCYPMIDHLIIDCNNIEKEIFHQIEKKQMISEILIIRRNITDYRKIMQVHKNVLKKLIANLKESHLYVMKKTDVYFESLIDYTKNIWDTLENLKERIEALQQTNESQISFRLSDIMKILTIISVITLPITLIASIFGMNTARSMPLIENQYGFLIVISIMVSIVIGMLLFFRKKGWF